MQILKLKASNFKSFANLDNAFGRLNILIGPNASGKSNVVQILKFLQDTSMFGLDDAVSMQGGIEYVKNFSAKENAIISVGVDFKPGEELFPPSRRKRKRPQVVLSDAHYSFGLETTSGGRDFRVCEDELTLHYVRRNPRGDDWEFTPPESRGEITWKFGQTRPDIRIPDNFGVPEKDIVRFMAFGRERTKRRSKSLLFQNVLLTSINPLSLSYGGWMTEEIGIYDVDPKLPKKAIPFTGKSGLEEDGSNLPIVLKGIFESQRNERSFSNQVHSLIPFIRKVKVEQFAAKSVMLSVRERFKSRVYLPASLISDGTINILALVAALFFEEKRVIVIEEPERNIHPSLMSKVASMLADASRRKQVFVTTHNAELIRYAELRDLYFVSRDDGGNSKITKPSENDDVKTFLANGMGLEELYVKNLLGP